MFICLILLKQSIFTLKINILINKQRNIWEGFPACRFVNVAKSLKFKIIKTRFKFLVKWFKLVNSSERFIALNLIISNLIFFNSLLITKT